MIFAKTIDEVINTTHPYSDLDNTTIVPDAGWFPHYD